jgi:ribonuclease J
LSHPHPELTAPPKLAENALRIVALGGLGEVGRNMTVIEHAGRLLVVDCGVLFPEDHHPGVDLILPDFATRTTSGPCRTSCASSPTSR